MSNEEIIRAWKSDEDDKDPDESKDSKVPANPAGEQELSDAELENVGGGVLPQTRDTCGFYCDGNKGIL